METPISRAHPKSSRPCSRGLLRRASIWPLFRLYARFFNHAVCGKLKQDIPRRINCLLVSNHPAPWSVYPLLKYKFCNITLLRVFQTSRATIKSTPSSLSTTPCIHHVSETSPRSPPPHLGSGQSSRCLFAPEVPPAERARRIPHSRLQG